MTQEIVTDPNLNEECKEAQAVVSKYGVQLVCPEDLEDKPTSDPHCENARTVASKHGFHITCPEDEEV